MKKGFTLVELLSTLIILGFLIVLTVPIYTTIYSEVKRNSLNGKIIEIKNAALKYGNSIKDEIKDSNNIGMEQSCIRKEISFLIENGYLESDSELYSEIINPTNNEPLDGKVEICYCKTKFELESYYVRDFDESQIYYAGDYVIYNNIKYRCVMDYNTGDVTSNLGINSLNKKGERFFKQVTC